MLKRALYSIGKEEEEEKNRRIRGDMIVNQRSLRESMIAN